MTLKIYKFHKSLFLDLPKLFGYLVVKCKNGNYFFLFFLTKKLVGKYTMARFTSINRILSKLKLV